MRSKAILGVLMVFLWVSAAWAKGQVEFTAKLVRVDDSTSSQPSLVVRLTEDREIPVRVSPTTQVRNENGMSAGLRALRAGDRLKIEGVFTDTGLLAVEVEVEDDGLGFELEGEIEGIDDSRRGVVIGGVTFEASGEVEIRGENDQLLPFSSLTTGQNVKISGDLSQGTLSLREIRLSPPSQGKIRLRGKVLEAESNRVLVKIPGNLAVPVQIETETEIRGPLAEGSEVEIHGRFTPALGVRADRVEVEDVFQLLPDEVRMDFNQTRRVDFLLATALPTDATVQLTSRNAAVARPVQTSVTLPAGSLTGSFMVTSLGVEGETAIDVVAGSLAAALKVEVERDQPGADDNGNGNENELLEIRWNPRSIVSGPFGPRQVQLELNGAAPEDLTIPLSLKEGSPDIVSFPASVQILQGDRSASVTIQVHDRTGRAKVRAKLPNSLGGDTDDLEIELESEPEAAQLELDWIPDSLELRPNQQAVATLRLSGPAPVDLEAVVSLRDGDAGLVGGVPNRIMFRRGDSEVSLAVSAGTATGEVRFRAALPVQFGGGQDDLKIRVRQ